MYLANNNRVHVDIVLDSGGGRAELPLRQASAPGACVTSHGLNVLKVSSRLLPRAPTAINHHRAASNHGTFVRRQVKRSGGDLFRPGHPTIQLG